MPKPFSCWVIVAGSKPTAFRSREAEDLLPTLKQLQRTEPEAALKWFERGRIWDSPEAAKAAQAERGPRRGREWRPGGNHVDPRAKYEISRDQKRARFKRNMIARNGPPTAAAGRSSENPRAGDSTQPPVRKRLRGATKKLPPKE